MPVKFLNAQGQGDLYGAVGAIRYATMMGARVISNSWGGGGYSALLDHAIQEAVAKGVILTAAAGNSSGDNDVSPNYPSGYNNVISVASTDETDSLSSFSNFGANSVMIAAPGSHIVSSIPGSKWASYSGTSMATPQVSGAIALALSVKPQASASEIKSALCGSARSILLGKVVCGRMDVGAFVSRL
jgi:subtilisin family serine protease